MKRLSIFYAALVAVFVWQACSKKDSTSTATPTKADFTFAMPGAGVLPTVVNFTSAATNATSYQWTFGDGNTSTNQNPSETYSAVGTYNVKLVVTGPGGTDSITKPVAIMVSKPKADFTYALVDSGAYPTHVNFTNASAGAASYKWVFSNGDTSSAQNPVDSFFASNTFNVKLIVTNAAGVDSVTKAVVINITKPKASFSYTVTDAGNYPTHVSFTNSSTAATKYSWSFGNGQTSTLQNPTDSFFTQGSFNVKLVASSPAGTDSVTQQITINFTKPTAGFSYVVTTSYSLPLSIACTNTSLHGTTYAWDFGDGGTSTNAAPTYTYKTGGIYTITLTATNPAGSTQTTQQIRVSPYPITYTDFNGAALNLYAWEGKTIMLLMRTPGLDPTTMFNWAKVMDSSYGYYYAATGMFPALYTNVTYLNNHVTIADVPSTCGAGCGYLGTTGIEMQNTYTDRMYSYALQSQYDQELFYECGRNYWYYGNQLAYKTSDPTATGFAIFMRFMAMDATAVNPAPFNSTNWTTFRTGYEGLVDTYVANTSYTWANTLGAGVGVSNTLGLGASDLWASFLSRLVKTYGTGFVLKVWKAAGAMPTAVTTQDAVDNFILSCCAAANKNLTTLFMTTWRWPMSAAAITAASKYPS